MGMFETIKKQPEKWIYRLLLTGVLASMLPIWYLSRYAVPACDDFTYGVTTYQAWQSTHSVTAVIQAAADMTAETWRQWQGTWSSVFLMTLQPGVFGEQWYFLTTFLMTFMLGGGISALVLTVLKQFGVAGKEMKYARGSCLLVLLLLTFQTMVSPVLGLYWYNGALHYVFMESLLFFEAAAMLKLLTAKKKAARAGWTVFTVIFGAVLGGANLLTGLQAAILGCLLVLYLFWKKKESRFWALLPVIANLAGFAFNVLAPGNSIRENTAEGMGVVMSVAMSFYWGAVYVTEWLTPVVLIGFTLMLPLIWKLAKRSETSFFKPLWAAGLSFCVFSAMFTPTLFATSSDGPDRCKHVMRIVLYLLVFFNLFNGFGWCMQHRKDGLAVRLLTEVEKKTAVWTAVLTVMLGAVLVLPADKNTYTTISALRSIASGEAAQYAKENEERLTLYVSDEKDIVIRPLTATPYLLHIDDVTNEGGRGYWLNLALMDYYEKDSITVSE